MKHTFHKKEIERLFELLNKKLAKEKIQGELYLVGGAVMCILFHERPATRDLDALFVPKEKIRALAQKIAEEEGLSEKWLNDGVKGFLSKNAQYQDFLDLSHLKIFTADPRYLFAMKCLAMRLGPEFRDEEDVRYLLRHLNIETYHEALNIIKMYYPLNKIPQKSFYVLEEILGK